MRHKVLRSLGVTLIVTSVLVASGGFLLERMLPRFIDMEGLKTKIEDSIQQATGIRAEIQEIAIKPTLFNGFRVVFNNNVLYDPEDIRVAQAGQVDVNVRYLPLLSHKTSISRIAFNKIEVYIGEKSFLLRLKRPKTPSEDVFLENTRLELNHYRIIVDRYFDNKNKYLLDGDHLALEHVKSRHDLELIGSGRGFYGVRTPNQPVGKFRFYAKGSQELVDNPQFDIKDIQRLHLQLQNVTFTTLSSIVQSYGIPLRATGKVDNVSFDYFGKNQQKVFLAQGATSSATRLWLSHYKFLFQPGKFLLSTQPKFGNQLTSGTLRDVDLHILGKQFDWQTQGSLAYRTPFENSDFNLHTKTSWIPFDTLKALPTLEPQQRRFLDALKAGNFSLDIDTQGTPLHPKITGTFKLIKTQIVSLKTGNLLADKVEGTLNILSPGHYKITNLMGNVFNAPFLVIGEIDLNNKTLKGLVKGDNINISKLQVLTRQFFPQIKVLQEFWLSGFADIQVRFDGALNQPRLEGHASLNRGTLYSIPLKQTLAQQINGSLLFDNHTIRIQKLQGNLHKAPVTISGTVTYLPWLLNLTVKGDNLSLAHIQDIVQALAQAMSNPIPLLQQLAFSGASTINLQLIGPLDQLGIVGTGALYNAEVLHRPSNIKLSNIDTEASFNQDAITFPLITALFQNQPVQGALKLSEQYKKLNGTFRASNFNLNTVQKLLQTFQPELSKQIALKGLVNFNVNATGDVEKPQLSGDIGLNSVDLSYLPKNLTFNRLVGSLAFKPEQLSLQNIRGFFHDIPFTLSGTAQPPDFKQYHLALTSENIPLLQLQQTLSSLVPAVGKQIQAAQIQSGTADVNLVIKPPLPAGIGGTIQLRNVTARPSQLGLPLAFSRLQYDLGTGKVQFPQGGLKIGQLNFNISGFASAKGYDLHLLSSKIPTSFLRDEKAFVEKLALLPLPSLYNTQGAFQIDAHVASHEKNLTLRLLNAGASLKELKYPLYNLNGNINISMDKGFKASTDSLAFRYGNSPAKVSFDLNGLQDMYVEMTGTLAPLLLNNYFLSRGTTIVAYAAVPFDINLSGKLGKLGGSGDGNNLNMFFNFNIASLFSNPKLEKPVEPGDLSLNQATLSSVLHLMGNTLKVERTRFQVGSDSSIALDGQIEELFQPDKRRVELSLITEPVLDLAALGKQFTPQGAQGLAGQIAANLKFITIGDHAASTGEIAFNHVQSSLLNLEDLHGKIRFDGWKAFLNIEHFQVPGVDLGFTATAPDLLQYPIPIVDLNLVGKEFIVNLYSEWITDIVIGKIRQEFWEQFFPNTGRVGQLPFEVKNGAIRMAEGIINNLIVENFTSTLRMYPNTYFELDQVHAQSAGGSVRGYFAMSPRDNNFMTVHMTIDKMKANAVSQILLNVTNQIFGDLSGIIDYTTEGLTPEAFLANTNGSADLRIENGRLPSIAKIENLLVAANTISGGLANLNLNSLFRLAAPFNTNYFAELTGNFKMVDGLIHTDNMISNGQNLDLLIKGTIRMVDGSANLVVRGDMDREIGGVLGPLGDISFGRFLGLIPPLRMIISHIPGLGFIPGFGGPKGAKGVAFEVNVIGPPTDPGSVKDFRWVK